MIGHSHRANGASFFTKEQILSIMTMVKGFIDAGKSTGVPKDRLDLCRSALDPLTEELIYLENTNNKAVKNEES